MRLFGMVGRRLGVLTSFLRMLMALGVIALAVMLGRGAMRLGRIFVMLGRFRM